MTVDEKVGQFLKQNRGKGFCDGCIAIHIKRPDGQSINRFQAGNATPPYEAALILSKSAEYVPNAERN